MMRGTSSREEGFTLPEVLACIVITGLVIFPLTAAVFDAMKITGSSGARTAVATDTDRLQAAVTEDINQAQSINIPKPVTATGLATGTAYAAIQHAPGELISGTPVAFAYNPTPSGTPNSWPCVNNATVQEPNVLSTVTWDASKNWIYKGASATLFWEFDKGAPVEGPYWYVHTWRAKFTRMPGAQYVKVEILRYNQTWDWTMVDPADWTTGIATPGDEAMPYLTGYCKPGATNVVQVAATAPTTGGLSHADITMTLNLRNSPADQPSQTVIDGTARYG